MENDVTVLGLNFSYEADNFGRLVEKELKKNGKNIPIKINMNILSLFVKLKWLMK